MIRLLIWSQVLFAAIGLMATLADLGQLPPYAFPPQTVLLVSGSSTYVCPIAVLLLGLAKSRGAALFVEAAASISLSLITIAVTFPLIQ